MIASPQLSKLLVCTVLLVGGFSRSNGNHEELAQARAELEAGQGEAAKAALPEPRQPAMITFAIHGYEGVNEAQEFGPLKAEFESAALRARLFARREPRRKHRIRIGRKSWLRR